MCEVLPDKVLQLIRKPDRIETTLPTPYRQTLIPRFSLENPIGIETRISMSGGRASRCYNSLENPIGIETEDRPRRPERQKRLQLIRKPDRD